MHCKAEIDKTLKRIDEYGNNKNKKLKKMIGTEEWKKDKKKTQRLSGLVFCVKLLCLQQSVSPPLLLPLCSCFKLKAGCLKGRFFFNVWASRHTPWHRRRRRELSWEWMRCSGSSIKRHSRYVFSFFFKHAWGHCGGWHPAFLLVDWCLLLHQATIPHHAAPDVSSCIPYLLSLANSNFSQTPTEHCF